MSFSRREMLSAAVGPLVLGAATDAGTSTPPVDVEERSLSELRAALESGVTSVQLVAAYQARIAKLDAAGPTLKSVLELNPDALKLAAERDAERAAGKVRGPLHGLPVLVKDNLDTADAMKTTAGSLAFLDAPTPQRDASVVQQLRDAGAVLLGKTNLSELANLRGRSSISGWSARGGLTRNPYVLTRNTSGSSSGSAAAVAASLCAAAIGTETDGSIVSPASVCGVVGFKPTVGLVSRAGIMPLSHTQDTAGPMTRSVGDAALVMDALVAVDARDPATATRPAKQAFSFFAALAGASLQGKRLGVVRRLVNASWLMAPLVRAVLKQLEQAGAVLVDVELGSRAYDDAENTVLLHEFKADFEAYLAARGGPVRTLSELVAFNEKNASRELPWFGQQLVEEASRLGPLSSPEYRAALTTCAQAKKDLTVLFSEKKLDAVVAPTGQPAWLTDFANGDAFTFSFSTPAAVAGCPHVSVPAGFVGELPFALSFVGAAWDDVRVLALGHAFERLTKARKAPRYFAR
ncbi:MAG: amidase [Myxococcaceae bacterium]